MAISGATKADALAAARKYGLGVREMYGTLNVANTTPTVSASEDGSVDKKVNVSWTNLDGIKYVDIGDGVRRGPFDGDTTSMSVTGVDAGTYTAKVYALGRVKESAEYTVT